MKDFIEKLIGRLEELYNSNDKMKKKAYEEQDWENFELFMHGNDGVKEAIEIVNQLAEEHNGGWIPCSERLPELYKTVLIQYHSKINNFDTIVLAHIDSFVGWKIEFGGSCDSDCVIAWQPLPKPYNQKGE